MKINENVMHQYIIVYPHTNMISSDYYILIIRSMLQSGQLIQFQEFQTITVTKYKIPKYLYF